MKIGVIGAGSLGGTVGRLWVAAGHEVLFSSRHPEELAAMVKRLGARARAGTPAEAAAFGDVVLFAVPYDALPGPAKDHEAALRGKIVIDACNPGPGGSSALTKSAEADGVAETSAKFFARSAPWIPVQLLRPLGARASDKLGVPLASNDADALQSALQLVRDAGCEPVAVADLAAARGFQRHGKAFRANTTAPKLRKLLEL